MGEKGISLLLTAVMVLTMMFSGCGQAQTQSSTQSQSESQVESQAANGFSEGSGTAEDPYKIYTAEQLGVVRNDLGAFYVLASDIDLSDEENWEPIGSFMAMADSATGEDPDPAYAFTGSFDGCGHKISGLKIDKSFKIAGPYMGTGLFGVVMGNSGDDIAEIKNLVIEDVNINGFCLVGSAVGLLGGNSRVDNVELAGTKNIINGCEGVGGVVGTGADAENYIISNCNVSNVTIQADPVDMSSYGMDSYPAACMGVVVGGLTGGELDNCAASDSKIIANGPNAYALGGVVGAPYATGSIVNCDAENVTIQADGSDLTYVGGIAGGAGTYGTDDCASITDCDVKNIQLVLSDNAAFVGGVVGGGKEETHGDMNAALGRFMLENCTASGQITAPNCRSTGALVGRSYLSPINDCTGNVTVNDEAADALGEDAALTALEGTYQGLFAPTIFKPEYDSLWIDYCSAVVGAESGEMMADMMKASVGGSIHGQEAIDSYASTPDKMQFDCNFIGGIAKLTFNGNTISGTDENGNEVFSHEYTYVSEEAIGADEGIDGFVGSLYKSSDDNSDEFSYFLILPDTPETTYHIEFRYGSDIDALKEYAKGKYGYWLAAGILENADEKMIEQVIALFCLENMDYSERSQSSVDQIAALVGTWDCDVSTYPEFAELGITGLYFIVDENGDGTTYAALNKSSEYTVTDTYNAYAYRNSNTDNSGIYVAYNPEEDEAQGSHYQITDNALSITTLDGEQISYTKRAAE